MTYPATNSNEAVELVIDAANQMHQVINGAANETVPTESGNIPSVRKAIADSLVFLEPKPWVQGESETNFLQIRSFNNELYWAPSATDRNPIPMGVTPVGDSNWKLAPLRLDKSSILSGLGKTNKGFWDENPVLEDKDDFVVERNTGDVFGAIYLPYFVDSTAKPDPTALVPFELRDLSRYVDETTLANETARFNLIVNGNFSNLVHSDSITRPDGTPRNYPEGQSPFVGWKVSSGGIQGLTLVNGLVSCTGGSLYQDVYKTNGLEFLNVVASTSGTDRIPLSKNVAVTNKSECYRVTVTPSNTYSVKLETGDSPTCHDLGLPTVRYEMRLSEFGSLLGNGIDQCDGIQTAMEICAENGVKLLIDGVYHVGVRDRLMDDGVLTRPCCLYIPSNSYIDFLPNAQIKQIANDRPTTYVMNFYLKENITVVNPVVYGDKDEHTGSSGEYGHCYNVTSCKNVKLIKPRAYNAWGDGFYVGLEYQGTTSKHLEDVTITDAVYDNISRNGISFTSGKNVRISLEEGGRVDRIAPKAGVDIEPEVGPNSPIKPTYENCHLWLNTSNSLSGLLVFFSSGTIVDSCDITVHNLSDTNSNTPLQLEKNVVMGIKGQIVVKQFTSTKSKAAPIFLKWKNDDLNFICDSATTIDSNYDGPPSDPQDCTVLIEGNSGSNYGGFYFNNITRGRAENTPLLYRNKVDSLQNSLLNFTDFRLTQAITENTGRIASNSNVIAKANTTFFQQNSKSIGVSEVGLAPSTADGITVTLNDEVGFTQVYTKTSANALPVKFVPESGLTLYYDSGAVNSVESTSYGAKIEILDVSGGKVAVPLSGTWITK